MRSSRPRARSLEPEGNNQEPHGDAWIKRRSRRGEIRSAVLGKELVDAAFKAADSFSMPMQELVTDSLGRVWGREGLDHKTSSMLNLAMIGCLNRPHELRLHIAGALKNGVSRRDPRDLHAGRDLRWRPCRCGFLPCREGSVREDRREIAGSREGSDVHRLSRAGAAGALFCHRRSSGVFQCALWTDRRWYPSRWGTDQRGPRTGSLWPRCSRRRT